MNNNNDTFRKLGTNERETAFIQAGSFMTFLYDKYGETKFIELHKNDKLDYEYVYKKTIEQLESEWLDYIYNRNK
ncbi:MAG: hypothetical protein JXB50_09510 [Spirochaetes bacterium]|nr:hypothetical protein [Spirochaetota bacterium]